MSTLLHVASWLKPSIKPKLNPKKDLHKTNFNHWQATSEDPFFELVTTTIKPCGWYMLNLKMTLSSATAVAKLYNDSGNDYNENEQLTIQLSSGRLTKRVIYFSTLPKRLRFDPCESPQVFSVDEFSFTKLTASRAKALMQKKLNGHGYHTENSNRLYLQYNDYLDRNTSSTTYQDWLKRNDLAIYAASLPPITAQPHSDSPTFSLLLATYNSDIHYLTACIESVLQQSYPDWQLCIADDASANPEVHALLDHYSAMDPRISVIKRGQNGHISQASNTALALARGLYVALIDHDDLLSPYALQIMAHMINSHPSAQFFYSDEDKIDEQDRRFSPHFKPDWNRDLFYSHNYITHFSVISKRLIDKLGGFKEGVEGSQDYDLFLRAVACLDDSQIIHTPHILNNCYRVHWPLPYPTPLVSLIIPTRDRIDLLERCINTILQKTTYRAFEIIIVNNQSSCPKTLEYFNKISNEKQIRVIDYSQPFNFSSINNFAASHANGSIIGLINNDIEVLSPGWLDEMVRHVCRPDIGCVGAKLYYPDMRIQHAGVVLGIGGVAGHSHKFFGQHHHGYHSRLSLVQNYSAVTAATLLVRKSVYHEVGGMETDLSVAFNDVDFCLKVRAAGYRNLWTPFAELIHHESVSRGYEDNPEKQARFQREVDYMKKQWGHILERDPCYSQNLSLTHEDFSYRA